jgi:hypothetical protein
MRGIASAKATSHEVRDGEIIPPQSRNLHHHWFHPQVIAAGAPQLGHV